MQTHDSRDPIRGGVGAGNHRRRAVRWSEALRAPSRVVGRPDARRRLHAPRPGCPDLHRRDAGSRCSSAPRSRLGRTAARASRPRLRSRQTRRACCSAAAIGRRCCVGPSGTTAPRSLTVTRRSCSGSRTAHPCSPSTSRRSTRAARAAETDGAEVVSLRDAGAVLPHSEAGLAAYLTALLNWHRRHRFCANCGARTDVVEGGLLAQLSQLWGVSFSAHRPGRDHARRARGATAAGPSAWLAASSLLDPRRIRLARRDARGGGRSRGPRGVGNRGPRPALCRLAAVAVPVVADARVHRAC